MIMIGKHMAETYTRKNIHPHVINYDCLNETILEMDLGQEGVYRRRNTIDAGLPLEPNPTEY